MAGIQNDFPKLQFGEHCIKNHDPQNIKEGRNLKIPESNLIISQVGNRRY